MDFRERLRQHFEALPSEQQAGGWDQLWQQQFTPWDREFPNPGLVETIAKKSDILGSPMKDGKRKRALVPGCGRGYDVLFLASMGYDAYGVEASSTAVQKCEETKKAQGSDLARYPTGDEKVGRGEATFLLADFFKGGFGDRTGGETFDLIYDYTFLCALPPQMRPTWSRRMAESLAPEGHLVCLEFPLGKDPKMGGPPFGLTVELYQQLLGRPGEEVDYGSDGRASEKEVEISDKALERISRDQAEKPHTADRGPDFVSIWQHRKN